MADFSWVPEELTGRFSYVNNKLVATCEICGTIKQTAGKGSVLKTIANGNSQRFRFCTKHGNFLWAKPSLEDIASWPEGHKRCRRCLIVKPFSDFHKHAACLFGINVECKECRAPISKKHYIETTIEYRLFSSAKYRAREKGREFNIELSDIFIPEICPVLGVPLQVGTDYAPSIDRIDSSIGYIKGNVRVISKRANTLKNNMTIAEAKLILSDLEAITDTI